MQTMTCTPRNQQGSMVIEALIAILLFSMGILAIVGLQAASIRLSTDAKYRADASLLANQLIGQMWVSDRTPATLASNFASASAVNNTYTAWRNNNVYAALPGVSGVPANQPTVTVSTAASSVGEVTITLFWKMPGEAASAPAHQYVVNAQIQ